MPIQLQTPHSWTLGVVVSPYHRLERLCWRYAPVMDMQYGHHLDHYGFCLTQDAVRFVPAHPLY